MTRHEIVGTFDETDVASFSSTQSSAGVVTTTIPLAAVNGQLLHGVNKVVRKLASLNITASATGVDLLVFATLVQAADTRIARSSESQDTWTREIGLVVPVVHMELWDSARPTLIKMLNFLTGDKWSVTFKERRPSPPPSRVRRVTPPPKFDQVSLFSGGLDSLIGAINNLESGGNPLLVSHAAEGAVSEPQNDCFDALSAYFPNTPLSRVRGWIHFPDGTVSNVKSESTSRGRSFLFLALGAAAGSGMGNHFVLEAPENGLIALNVPLDPLRLGSLSTRTTHPYYFKCWNDLLSTLGIDGEIRNPYWNLTKGEMISSCSNASLLRDLLPLSVSCASPAKARWVGRSSEHCGYCVPCIIRRAAVAAAWGDGEDPTEYTLPDLNARPLDTRHAEGFQLRSFQFSIHKLFKSPGSEKILIHKPGPLPERAQLASLADVYRRGMMEVHKLIGNARTTPLASA
jgi:hypothetical protein